MKAINEKITELNVKPFFTYKASTQKLACEIFIKKVKILKGI
jgi:hypothetical protein